MVSDAVYEAARRRAAMIDRGQRGRLFVSGPDRASYLQGLLTNDIAALRPGLGCYAAYLTPQGRMITDLLVYELGDRILLSLPIQTRQAVFTRFSDFIFTEDVVVADATETLAAVGIVGPDAAERLGGICGGAAREALARLPEHGNAALDCALRGASSGRAIVARTTDAGEPGFDVYLEPLDARTLAARLADEGIPIVDAETAEAIRIEAGVPLFGRDMDDETIPLEAGIESRAVSFTKGCYVGQEVIVRVLHRGHGRVARKLGGVTMQQSTGGTGSSIPRAGAPVRMDEREVGHVTSATWSPSLNRPIALAYLHRDVLTAGTAVSVDGVGGVVTSLPFVSQ